jgi:hypothetical protein
METNSESPIIIQMLKNVKSLIELSKGRDCWTSDELPNINITYHNVCEIAKQLQAKQTQEKDLKRFEEIKEDLEPELDESIEIN